MKNNKFILCLFLALTSMCFSSVYSQTNNHLIVIVKYKTLPGKDSIALTSIKSLVEKVKKEPNYLNIIIHVDPNDKSNIMLYEHWSDGDYYKGEHMNTPHLQQFMGEARLFLGGPPEITFWEIKN